MVCRETRRMRAGEGIVHAESDQAISLHPWLRINSVLHNHNALQVLKHTHLTGRRCYTSSLSHAHDISNVPHTHIHHVAYHISNFPSDTLSPPMLCVLLRPLSAVTDWMTGGRCSESCLGWWPHSWVPPAPHLGTPAARQS